jgi:hypothetical protein
MGGGIAGMVREERLKGNAIISFMHCPEMVRYNVIEISTMIIPQSIRPPSESQPPYMILPAPERTQTDLIA